MIDYPTYCRIHDCHHQQGLNVSQIARHLNLDAKTVTKWLAEPHYRQRPATPRRSKPDPYKAQIQQWLETHPFYERKVRRRGYSRLFVIRWGDKRSGAL